MAFHLN